MLYVANINTLATRREDISKKIVRDITNPSSCLHHLLPGPREQSHTSRLKLLKNTQELTRVLDVIAHLLTMP